MKNWMWEEEKGSNIFKWSGISNLQNNICSSSEQIYYNGMFCDPFICFMTDG